MFESKEYKNLEKQVPMLLPKITDKPFVNGNEFVETKRRVITVTACEDWNKAVKTIPLKKA